MKMDLGDAMTRIDERLAEVEGLARLFREQQTGLGGAVTAGSYLTVRTGAAPNVCTAAPVAASTAVRS